MKKITFTTIEQMPDVKQIKDLLDIYSKETLLTWATKCFSNLLEYSSINPEANAIYEEIQGHNNRPIPVPIARKMSLRVHAIARSMVEEKDIYLYRALGHTIATIHTKRHSYGCVLYGVKALFHMDHSDITIPKFTKESLVLLTSMETIKK